MWETCTRWGTPKELEWCKSPFHGNKWMKEMLLCICLIPGREYTQRYSRVWEEYHLSKCLPWLWLKCRYDPAMLRSSPFIYSLWLWWHNDMVPCLGCQKSSSNPLNFLLNCISCANSWHHSLQSYPYNHLCRSLLFFFLFYLFRMPLTPSHWQRTHRYY